MDTSLSAQAGHPSGPPRRRAPVRPKDPETIHLAGGAMVREAPEAVAVSTISEHFESLGVKGVAGLQPKPARYDMLRYLRVVR